MRLLIVEDNEGLAFGLAKNLEFEGYDAIVARDGERGLALAAEEPFDLVLLDLMLPGMDGYRVLETLRARGSEVPVLIVSARDEELDKVRGFRLGADDYVTKPFGVLELLARIEALLRRAGRTQAEERACSSYAFGSVEVDATRRSVKRAGARVELAPLEFDLLLALLRRRGTAASRQELLTEVWGHAGKVLTRTVDTHIAQLRRKLEAQPSRPAHILTVRKYGYRVE